MARRARPRWGWAVLAAWALPAAIGAAFWNGWLVLPDRWNPWAPLWPQEAPNALTAVQAAPPEHRPGRLRHDVEARRRSTSRRCPTVRSSAAAAGPMRFASARCRRASARRSCSRALRRCRSPCGSGTGCSPRRSPPSARTSSRSTHYGSFSCRDIGGRRGGEGSERRSEHATANALDIAAFVLADGSTISVARDWSRGDDDARARFLREVHDGACGLWSVVLGPDYNAAHRDHLHLDRGRSRACR